MNANIYIEKGGGGGGNISLNCKELSDHLRVNFSGQVLGSAYFIKINRAVELSTLV